MALHRNEGQCGHLEADMEDRDRWDSPVDRRNHTPHKTIPTNVVHHRGLVMDHKWAVTRRKDSGLLPGA